MERSFDEGPGIGFFAPYFGLFDEAMPPWFRSDRARHADIVRSILESHGRVVFPGLVDSLERAEEVADEFERSGVEILVLSPTMAAPPAYAGAVLDRLPNAPVVVVAAQDRASVPDGYDTTAATQRSLPVGFVMITNVLVRRGRPFASVVGVAGSEDFQERLADALTGGRAAVSVRNMMLLQVGEPIEGYDDVLVEADDLIALGIGIVSVSATELAGAFTGISGAEVDEQQRQDILDFDAAGVDVDVHRRSARLTCALRQLCAESGVAGGTVNCHGGHFRWSDDVGITACLAVSRLTAEGCPFSCTGDIPTAIALTLGRSIAGSALYCELYQLDFNGNWLLVANGGEGDVTIRAPGSTPRLLPEDHYMGVHGPGTAVAFPLPIGAATLLSLTPTPAASRPWRLIVAHGEIIGSRHEAMDGPNGMFSFAKHDVRSGFAAWCAAGATHHAVLLPGHRGAAIDVAGAALGIDARII